MQGLPTIVIVGVLQACVGIVMTRVSRLRNQAIPFYAVGCWITAAIAWLVLPDWEVLRYRMPDRMGELAVWMVFAAGCNACAQLSLLKAMSMGHKGISWAVVQSAMLIPFLLSIIIWNEPASPASLAGIVLQLSAIALLAKREDAAGIKPPMSFKWTLFVLGALVLLGLTQTCQGVSSHWQGWNDTAGIRIPLFFTAGAFFYTLFMLARRQRPDRASLGYACLWSALALGSYLLLFRGLDYLAAHGMSRCVFPLGQTVCMLSFALYSALVLGEAFVPRSRLGLFCATLGIALISL